MSPGERAMEGVTSRVASDPPQPWHLQLTNAELRLTRHALATLYNVACNIGMRRASEGMGGREGESVGG